MTDFSCFCYCKLWTAASPFGNSGILCCDWSCRVSQRSCEQLWWAGWCSLVSWYDVGIECSWIISGIRRYGLVCWRDVRETGCSDLWCGLCQVSRDCIVWNGQGNYIIVTWWHFPCSFLALFRYDRQYFVRSKSVVKIRHNSDDDIGEPVVFGLIPAFAPFWITSNKWPYIYITIACTIVVREPQK